MENLKEFMKENYKDNDIDKCQLVIDAKKEVFDDIDKYLAEVDKQIPWHLLVSRGIKLNIKPDYNDIKKKHGIENDTTRHNNRTKE